MITWQHEGFPSVSGHDFKVDGYSSSHVQVHTCRHRIGKMCNLTGTLLDRCWEGREKHKGTADEAWDLSWLREKWGHRVRGRQGQ